MIKILMFHCNCNSAELKRFKPSLFSFPFLAYCDTYLLACISNYLIIGVCNTQNKNISMHTSKAILIHCNTSTRHM